MATPKKTAAAKVEYRKGSLVVYPAHGLGKVLGTETREVSGQTLELIVIHIEGEKLTLRVPLGKAKANGLRGPSSPEVMADAIAALASRPQRGHGVWARRAMDFNAKISSGNPVSLAEVVRDLHGNVDSENRSYSERQIYETALDRLVRELAAVAGISENSAGTRVLKAADSARPPKAPKVEAEPKPIKIAQAPKPKLKLVAEAAAAAQARQEAQAVPAETVEAVRVRVEEAASKELAA